MNTFNNPQYNSIKVLVLLAIIAATGYFIFFRGGDWSNNLLGRVILIKPGTNVTWNPNNNLTNVMHTGTTSSTDCNSTNAGMVGTLRYCNEIFDQSQIVVTTGIQFSSTYDLKFDLYTPPTSDTVTNRPLLITLHGGGVDESVTGPCNKYARMGYVCMAGDYRTDNSIPGFSAGEQKHAAQDLLANVRFARIHATDYGIDPNKIMVGGISAGGTTALEAAIIGNNLDNVNWFSPTDTQVNKDNQFGIVSSVSCLATSNSGAPMTSTNNLIGAGDPPTSLFLGEDDITHGWTCDTGQVFTDAMTAIGIPSYFQCFADTGHSLNKGPEIDAVVIPMAYKELITETCPQ